MLRCEMEGAWFGMSAHTLVAIAKIFITVPCGTEAHSAFAQCGGAVTVRSGSIAWAEHCIVETKMSNTSKTEHEVRDLTNDEVDAVVGAGIFDNTGCIRINPWLQMPTYNPWLDPYSPERRQA